MDWLRAGVAEISGQFPLFAVYRLKSVLLPPRTDISFVYDMGPENLSEYCSSSSAMLYRSTSGPL